MNLTTNNPRIDAILAAVANYTPNYPRDAREVISEGVTFKRGVLTAMRQFKRSKPYRGTLEERKAKFKTLHDALCAVYEVPTKLVMGEVRDPETPTGNGYFHPASDTIALVGKLSVVTYLHEFAHALGRDEQKACRWSLNLFKRVYPRLFDRLQFNGHMAVAPPR